MANHLWTVVLAAGAGRRLARVTGDVPKQFWRDRGRTSLLEDTAERFALFAPSSRTVVVVDDTHRKHVTKIQDPGSMGTFVFQPQDRGTAAGVLIGLMPVLDSEPEAVVAITPADHGVVNDSGFRRGLLEALCHVQANKGPVLFGVEPTGAYDDYGWITPGLRPSSRRLYPIASFVEKPRAEIAAALFAKGAVWNTMVVVARASDVRALYVEYLPELAEVFDIALQLPAHERALFLQATYPRLRTTDFSRDLLTPARNLSTYIWPVSVGWSDLGTPERLHEWHRRTSRHHPTTAISAA